LPLRGRAIYFLQKKSLFLFGLDKRINGNTLSVDDFFSKVNKKLNKDNTKILQEQVCYCQMLSQQATDSLSK
jgi:hypothetical protein